ncbi:hypothetical protein ABTK03_21110, partial [Acinetobacter baumannii]
LGYDSVPGRLLVFSIAETLPLVLSLRLLLSREGRANPGARLAGIVVSIIVAIYIVRLAAGVTGAFSYAQFTPLQSVVVLALVF